MKTSMMALMCFFVLAVGLVVDVKYGRAGQTSVSIVVWMLYLFILLNVSRSLRTSLITCTIIATAGEIVFSLVMGLYEYQFMNIPLYVPPGHGLVYFLGVYAAEKLPKFFIWLIPFAFSIPAVSLVQNGEDVFGIFLFAIFLVYIFFLKQKMLYATMFGLSYLLEIWGTHLGNWVWSNPVPGWGITSLNPPLGVGSFYCVLDSMVIGAVYLIANKGRRHSAKSIELR